MNKTEVLAKIESLSQAAEGFEGATKAFKLDDVARLKIELEGMAIQEVADKMNSISLPDIAEMDKAIEEAANAIETHDKRVAAFNKGFKFIKTALNVVV